MRSRYFLVSAVALVLLAATSIFAQPPATQTKPQTPATNAATATQASGNVPLGKVAVIFSAVFQHQTQGIAKFPVLANKLNAEFQKTQADLDQTAKNIGGLQDEIKKLQGTAGSDPKVVQSKIDQLDQLKKDYQRRGEDAQAAYARRRQEIFTPLQDDVGKALDAYAKSRGIMLVIDASQVEGILFAAETIDITRAFISDYNSKNPAAASAATPGQKP